MEQEMPRPTQLLKVSVIGLFVVTGLAACRPTYVRESYHDPHFLTYASVSTYSRAPAYSVQYYSSVGKKDYRRSQGGGETARRGLFSESPPAGSG
jgi:hypothetical protein